MSLEGRNRINLKLFIAFRSTMTQVVSGLQRLDPSGSGGKVAASVDDTIKIVEDLTRIH